MREKGGGWGEGTQNAARQRAISFTGRGSECQLAKCEPDHKAMRSHRGFPKREAGSTEFELQGEKQISSTEASQQGRR